MRQGAQSLKPQLERKPTGGACPSSSLGLHATSPVTCHLRREHNAQDPALGAQSGMGAQRKYQNDLPGAKWRVGRLATVIKVNRNTFNLKSKAGKVYLTRVGPSCKLTQQQWTNQYRQQYDQKMQSQYHTPSILKNLKGQFYRGKYFKRSFYNLPQIITQANDGRKLKLSFLTVFICEIARLLSSFTVM